MINGIFFVVSVLLVLGSCDTVGNNIVAVSRRSSKEIYFQTTCNGTQCYEQHSVTCYSDTTYFVAEQQCVNNSNLFNGMVLMCM